MSFFLAVLSKFSDCLLILAAHLESPPIFLPDPSEHDDVGLGKRTQDAEVLWFPLCAHEILVFDAIDQSDIRHAPVCGSNEVSMSSVSTHRAPKSTG